MERRLNERFQWEMSSIWTKAMFIHWRTYDFPRTAVTNLVTFKNRNVFSHSSEGHKSKIKVSSGPHSSWKSSERILFFFSQLLLALARLLWVVVTWFQSLLGFGLAIFLWPLCTLSVSYKDALSGFRTHPNPLCSHLCLYSNYICNSPISE